MKTIRLFFVLVLVLSFAPGFTFAQMYDDDDCGWGYIFSVQNNFTIGKVNLGNYFDNNNNETTAYGIGVEKYLTNRWSLTGGLSLGIDSETDEGPNGDDESSITEFGVKLGTNFYFQGMKNIINPYAGAWVNYLNYGTSTTTHPNASTTQENKFSSSALGFGLTTGVYVNPWSDVGFSIGAAYNLGYFMSPESTLETTVNGQTTETKGPSRSRLTDCGGELMVRFSF